MKIKFENSVFIYIFISAVLLSCVVLSLAINDLMLPSPKIQLPADANTIEYRNKLAPGFPEFPVYPDATVDTSRTTKDPNGEYFEAYLWSDKSTSDVSIWYSEQLTKDGWELLDESSDEQMIDKSLVFKNGETKAAITAESGHEDRTEIAIYLTFMH